MKEIAFLIVFLAPLATASIAHADTKAEARRHFDRAVELVDDGQLEGALVEFQRSYDLTHHFAVLYNIGQVLVSLARPVEAVDAYQRYLADGRDKVPAARRAEVEREVARQKARIATLEIRGLPDGAVVRLDGKEIGKTPSSAVMRVGVGKHTIAATADGYAPATSEVTVAGEDVKVVNLALTRNAVAVPPLPPPAPVTAPMVLAPVAPPVAVAAPLPPPPSQAMSRLRIAGIVTGAVGLATLAAGGFCAITAESRHNEAMRTYTTDYPKAKDLQQQARSYITAANVSLAAGGALTALGVVMFVVGTPAKPAATAGMQTYLLPAVGPGVAGLGAGGVW